MKRSVTSRNLNELNIENFKSSLGETLPSPNGITADGLNETLRCALDTYAPLVTRTVTERPVAQWFSLTIKAAKQERRCAERRWLASGLQVHKDIFKFHRNKVNNLIRKVKQDFFLNKFEQVKSCKELFSAADQVLGKSKKSVFPSIFGSETILCNNFLSFFDDKIRSIRQNLDKENNESATHPPFKGNYLENFDPISEQDVKIIIESCASKSCDLDPVPTDILKQCLSELLPCITKVLNDSLQTGLVPDPFKHAIVKPLLKKAGLDENELKNYRPISNLPFLSKVLEKIVMKQLLHHLKINDLDELFQSAYKSYHSTETAILKVCNDILNEIDEKKVCLLTLLDLSAAFDTIDHNILIERLNKTFGITGIALRWFESYITNRTQSVKIRNECSDSHVVLTTGVPQGSVLGPIIFTLYTQPLVEIFKKFEMQYHLYADDSQLYKSGHADQISNIITLTEMCVNEVKHWMAVNKLKLNDDKTEIILFKNPRVSSDISEVTLNINDNMITSSKSVKDLGVLLDYDLSMSSQVSSLCKNMYFKLKQIGSVRQFLTTSVTATLVTSLVLSKLDYCNSVLSGITGDKIKKLQTVQNNAARLVMKKKKRDHITPLLKDLHWLPVPQRIEYKNALMCYKCLNGLAPDYLSNLLEVYSPNRPLRSSTDQTLFKTKTKKYKSYGERSFSYVGPQIWNKLPKNVRHADNLNIFKRKLKHHLFVSAFEM